MTCGIRLLVAFVLIGHSVHGRLGDSFSRVKEHFNVKEDVLSNSDITTLVKTLLYRVKCDSFPVDCQTCLPTPSLQGYLNRTAENSLDEDGFLKLSVILGVFMRNLTGECKESSFTIDARGRSYEQFLETFVEDEHHDDHDDDDEHHDEQVVLDIHVLEDILHEIEENYRPGSLVLDDAGLIVPTQSGIINYLIDVKCFSPQSLFADVGQSTEANLKHEDIEGVAGSIVANLLMGHCVRAENLPTKVSFLANLFATYADNSTGRIDLEAFEKILSKMGIGQEEDHEGAIGHDDMVTHLHKKRKKREEVSHETSPEILGNAGRIHRFKRASAEYPSSSHGYDVTQNCYSGRQLLDIYSANSTGIDVNLFRDLCPAILQQVLNSSCGDEDHEDIDRLSSSAEAYGYGTLAVFIITTCSVFGVFYVKIRDGPVKVHVLVLMMSLAIGTLSGDATLHLIPAATGLHNELHDDHAHGAMSLSNLVIEEYVWFMLTVLGSLYAFFLLELIMTKYAGGHGHSHGIHDHRQRTYELEGKDKDGSISNGINGEVPGGEVDAEIQSNPKHKNRALAVMIVLGDAIHNFADGLAVGAAFAVSVTSGISTSLAVFCHELPHELGDFAALISSGLSVKKALLMNVLSGMTAFIGLYVGVAVVDQVSGTEWIFAAAAGMFIYVALADIVPEVNRHFKASKHGGTMFVCINIGIILGFGSMFIIAIFEEYIKVG